MYRKRGNELKFSQFGFEGWLVKNCYNQNLIYPSSLQQACIPPIMSRKDLLVFSKPGSGKTLTYLLPILNFAGQTLVRFFSVVITPIKETCFQVFFISNKLSRGKSIKCWIPKKNFWAMRKQIENFHCLILTPKFFSILPKNKKFFSNFDHNLWVFSEIEIISQNFYFVRIFSIFRNSPPTQIMLFGAVFTRRLAILTALNFQKNFFFFWEKRNLHSSFFCFKHEYIFCPFDTKLKFLKAIIKTEGDWVKSTQSKEMDIIVIFSSNKNYQKAVWELRRLKIPSRGINSHVKKTKSLFLFKEGTARIRIILTRDLIQKGFFRSGIKLIINFDFPTKTTYYLRNIWRLDRFLEVKSCLNLINQKEIKFLTNLENHSGICLEKSKIFVEKNLLSLLTKK